MTAHSEDRFAVVFDTETTGLIENTAIPLKSQPHIIELCAVKLRLPPDGEPEEVGMFSSLFHPGFKVEEETTKITGITNDMLLTAVPFASKLRELQRFFFGTHIMVGHNLPYDRDMLHIELRRLQMEYKFPWPPRHLCTVELSETLKGFRLGLNDLHEELLGVRFSEHHRAEPDTRATTRCFIELIKKGLVRL